MRKRKTLSEYAGKAYLEITYRFKVEEKHGEEGVSLTRDFKGAGFAGDMKKVISALRCCESFTMEERFDLLQNLMDKAVRIEGGDN